ncbi:unnamed protein product [Caenorhabditis auriculariae]|uniref:Uncharacterized protein n=1 Tax=Caenorhabditis auriculariae TaxID=2777116 RepID=A0A8S1H103_9PELO|nr:unnamed protein product [Caenorhabditis auriculariae]
MATWGRESVRHAETQTKVAYFLLGKKSFLSSITTQDFEQYHQYYSPEIVPRAIARAFRNGAKFIWFANVAFMD